MKKCSLLFAFLVSFASFEVQAIDTRFEATFPIFKWFKFKMSYDTDISATIYASIAAASLAVKVGYDWSWHGDYSVKSSLAFNEFIGHVQANKIVTLKDPLLLDVFKRMDPDFCILYESWLRDSYASWLTPWNWTNSQKTAYEKMEILSMISLHAPMVVLDEVTLAKEIVTHARRHCGAVSGYPLLYYADLIDTHLAAIKKGFSVENREVRYLLKDLEQELYKLKHNLRSSEAYVKELHAKRTHDLMEQAANR